MKKVLIVLMLALAGHAGLRAKPDVQKVVLETQQFRQSGSEMDLVWWIPTEYWELSLGEETGLTPEARKQFLALVDQYLVFAVLEGKLGVAANLTGTPKEELLRKVTARAGAGELKPLEDAQLSGDARNFFQMMRPLLAQMLGQLGQGMHFIVFEGRNAKGQRHADPNRPGFLTVKVGPKEFQWRLPLGCFLPAKYDAKTGEEFPGNYVYSPFTGAKLVSAKPGGASKADAK